MPANVRPELDATARARRLADDERAYRRRVWRRRLAQLLGCVGSCAAGLYLLGLSFHLSHPGNARIAFWGGLLVGNLGMFVTLLLAHLDAKRRGDE